MDPHRFDRIARGVATGSRRRLLTGLAASTLGGSLALLGRGEVGACRALGSPCGRTRQCCAGRCRNERCRCDPNETRCVTYCANTANDDTNCGTCGNICFKFNDGFGQICYDSACCYPGPDPNPGGARYGCNPEVYPNPSCCSGVCQSDEQCAPLPGR